MATSEAEAGNEAEVGNEAAEVKVRNEAEAKVEVNADTVDKINILEPLPMNAIIMAALEQMYDQPHMFPEFSEAMRSLPFIT